MKSIEKLELMVARWLEPLPHLPISARKWIADNIWWIVLVGVILSVIGTLGMIGGIFTAIALMGTTFSAYGYSIAPAYTGWFVMSLVISFAFMVASVILTAMSVSPLKIKQKEGWMLLFYTLVLRAVAVVIGAFFTYSMFGFIGAVISGAIGIAISAYLLYEIRSYFNISVKSKTSSKK